MYTRYPPDPTLIARRGLLALQLLALAALVAAAVVWWLIAGADGLDSPGGLALAVVVGAALALPGLLLVHFTRTLYRASALAAELRERAHSDEPWANDPRLFMRSVRLAMRERGIGLLATPWYWLLALWAVGASGLLVIGALVLGLAALL